MKKQINVTRSFLPPFQEYCDEIKEMWDSHWLTNMGTKHKQLETELKDYLDAQNIKLYTNGHLALENAIEALGLSGEIITTPYTFASTTHAIVRCGCKPVFCDIDFDTFTMDPSKIELLITENTTAILPVHVYGNLCHVDTIKRIAQKHKLRVIYDAAHAFGVRYKGASAANFGDISMFSFHATKVFHTIEGGALTFADPALSETLNGLKNFGILSPEEVAYVGGNAKMNEFQAAMGICNLRHVDYQIEQRRNIWHRYAERLCSVKGLRLNSDNPDLESNYSYFPVVFDNYKYNRDEVYHKLETNGIKARKYFFPLTNSFDCYTGIVGFEPDRTPVAQYVANRILTLPLYADLTYDQVDRICDVILS